jgi:hypothetical protein
VRCSRVRSSAFGRRPGRTVRKILVGVTSFQMRFCHGNPRSPDNYCS